jgi:hypothetical protein
VDSQAWPRHVGERAQVEYLHKMVMRTTKRAGAASDMSMDMGEVEHNFSRGHWNDLVVVMSFD